MIIRDATLRDAKEILDIYAPFVSETTVSFETEVPTENDFMRRMDGIMKSYPYVVCETDEGRVVGYAYASRHRERAAYRFSADVSVYIHPDFHRQKIGTMLYNELLSRLEKYEIYTLYAIITLPNEKSVGFHEAFGFHTAGVTHNVGYKLGNWLDVICMEKQIKEYTTPK